MSKIIDKQVLEIENLISYRGNVCSQEFNKIVSDMQVKLKAAEVMSVGHPITVIYGMSGDKSDVEILIPVNKKVDCIKDYAFKKRLKIVNALVVQYKGNPALLQHACNRLNQYIIDHKLMPITAGYNVTKNIDQDNIDDTEIDVYVGISPNIL